jgi:hypothetical protein
MGFFSYHCYSSICDMRSIFFCIIALITCSSSLWGQAAPHIEIQLLSNEQVSELNLDRGSFPSWTRGMTNLTDSAFLRDKTKRDVMVLVTLHTAKDPEVRIYARPSYTPAELEQVQQFYKRTPVSYTRLTDYSFLYLIRLNGGNGDKAAAFIPAFEDPAQITRKNFKRANLSDKKNMLINWATTEALPLIAAAEMRVEEKFSGVHYMALTLNSYLHTPSSGITPQQVLRLTDSTADYWRGVMEMSPGNELVSLSKVLLMVAAGQFDYAKEYNELLKPFGSEKALATYYMKELSWRLEEFDKELSTRTQRGIDQRLNGNYAGAVAIDEGIDSEYPNSAWLKYELFYCHNMLQNEDKKDSLRTAADWRLSKMDILNCNPLYPIVARAFSGEENYQAFRRSQISTLFKDKNHNAKDVAELADIALDLHVYGYAAEVYWLSFSRIKKEELGQREMLPYYLYCLEHLGVKSIKETFKGDFEKEFKRIEKERRKKMEESVYFKPIRKKR